MNKSLNKVVTLIILTLLSCLWLSSSVAMLLEGSVYNSNLELEKDVFIEINTIPAQKILAKEGKYSLELPPGEYTLTARKGFNEIIESLTVIDNGHFVLDLFLLPDLTEESRLLKEAQEELALEDLSIPIPVWSYVLTSIIFLILFARFFKLRKKYGSLRQFRAKVKEESAKMVENNPQYLEQALELIKNHDGRIHQKTLRQELLHLSEAKVSLIVSELEHKGLVERFKKGRGNIIILK